MKRLCVATFASLLLLGTTLAQANPRGAAHVESMFRTIDTNRDGVITIAESDVAIEAEFRRHDLDKDGLWSYAEVRKQQLDAGASQLPPDLQAKVIAGVFAGYDVDGDRRITLANYRQVQTAFLLQADFDKDGQVTLREARQLHGVDAP
ncbi:EF-hand domain-containing protein [Luteimonas terrae]|uniref:Ca2+-binding EF-hand superfamily protein n=1 Tax=Luteimonas terrae TaxID=1530191 RepID=A0ABU1XV06_9GAMM|nr:EF-hand domain-containing protein [Luteimonas terrae]MDR7192065.1 Ca2+-binding EF-hand superfamily protein [Luteimonas terrae]